MLEDDSLVIMSICEYLKDKYYATILGRSSELQYGNRMFNALISFAKTVDGQKKRFHIRCDYHIPWDESRYRVGLRCVKAKIDDKEVAWQPWTPDILDPTEKDFFSKLDACLSWLK